MIKGETGAEPQVEYVVTKENGFGQVRSVIIYSTFSGIKLLWRREGNKLFGLKCLQVVRNHETEEQFNPQALFYKSLWLKARADRSLMEYETFLSNSRT